MKNQSIMDQQKEKKWLLAAAVFVVILLGIWLMFLNRTQPVKSTANTHITYAMPITIAAIPAYVASEKGFWRNEGLTVNRQMFSSGRLALDALLSNSAEVMSVSETPLIHAILQGNKIAIIGTVTEHQETKFLGRSDLGILRPEDLRGKKIATLAGTNSDYFMFQFFEKHRIAAAEVSVISMQPPDMVTALVNGSIDGYFAWEPHISYAKKRLGDKAVEFLPGDLYRGRHCIAMNSSFLAQQPEVAEKLLRGFMVAQEFTMAHPAESKEIVGRVTGLDAETLESLWGEYTVKVELDKALSGILERQSAWARARGEGTTSPPDAVLQAVWTESLRKISASAVTYDDIR
ncbi:MAG: NrtA/SsuA/CpmA family ABC transporter substrate-binding protein [Verrucomicrobiota bacterium]